MQKLQARNEANYKIRPIVWQQLRNHQQLKSISFYLCPMDQKDQQEQPDADMALFAQQNEEVSKDIISSEHYDDYCKEMEKVKHICESTKVDFAESGIVYTPQLQQNFSFQVVSHLNNFEVVFVEVRIGGFKVLFKILNRDEKSPLLRFPSIGEGAYGKIFESQFQGVNLAIKSIAVPFHLRLADRKREIARVLKEFSICKICSVLGVGPSMPKVLGFDAVLYRTSFEFPMEKCTFLNEFFPENEQTLLQDLGLLHLHKLIHSDINPKNIMFSPLRNRVVYIDFGFSNIIKQNCGFKTFTQFSGTVPYVSQEMLKLFLVDNQEGFVDLYYNDLVALKKSISKLKLPLTLEELKKRRRLVPRFREIKTGFWQEKQQLKIVDQLAFIYFKHSILFRRDDIEKVFEEHKTTLIQQYPKPLLKIFTSLLPSPVVENIVLNKLTALSHLDEYEEFEVRFKLLRESSFPKLKKNEEHTFSEWWEKESELQSAKDKKGENTQNKKKKFDIIFSSLKKREFFDSCLDKSEYYSQLFDCLRFDKKNLNFEKKIELSTIFLQFVGKVKQKDKKILNVLFPIQATLKFLFSFCLRQSQKEWRQQYRFDILVAVVMTESDVLEELAFLEKSIVSEENLDELFTVFFELFNLTYIFERMIFQEDVGVIMEKKVKEFLKKIVGRIENLNLNSSSPHFWEAEMMKVILHTFLNDECSKQSELLLKRIENTKKREEMQEMLLKIKNNFSSFRQHEIQFYGTMKSFKAKKMLKNLSFAEKMYYSQLFFFQDERFSLARNLFECELKQTINCLIIFSKFVFYNKQFYAMAFFPEKFKENFRKILKTCFHQERLPTFSLFIFTLEFILYNNQIAIKYADLIQQLHQQTFRQDLLEKYSNVSRRKKETIFQVQFISIFLVRLIKNPYNPPLSLYNKPLVNQYWKSLNEYALGNLNENQLKSLVHSQYYSLHQNNFSFPFSIEKRRLQMVEMINDVAIHYSLSGIIFQALQKFKQQKVIIKWSSMMRLWCHRYAMLYDLIFIEYFSLKNMINHAILKVLQTLFDQSLFQQIFQFLVKLVQTLGQYSSPQFCNYFSDQIIYFMMNHIQLFKCSEVVKYFGPITWENRFCFIITFVSLYAFSTGVRFIILRTFLIKHIKFLPIQMKFSVLFLYYRQFFRFFMTKFINFRAMFFIFRTQVCKHYFGPYNKNQKQFKKMLEEIYRYWSIRKRKDLFNKLLIRKFQKMLEYSKHISNLSVER